MTHIARCGIYTNRPKFCRDYPTAKDAIPAACTFRFLGDKREGTCQPEVCQEQACCNWPREGGEPEGAPCTLEEGGKPCKHMKWEEVAPPKEAEDAADYDPGDLYDAAMSDMVFQGD